MLLSPFSILHSPSPTLCSPPPPPALIIRFDIAFGATLKPTPHHTYLMIHLYVYAWQDFIAS